MLLRAGSIQPQPVVESKGGRKKTPQMGNFFKQIRSRLSPLKIFRSKNPHD
jgi:hypothetical protein